MRILHTCLRYPPATGGVETYVHEIVERTRSVEAQRDVRVLTSAMRTHGPISMLAPELLLDDPPYVQRTHVAATPLLSYPRLQGLAYYIGHHQPDILHGYSFWYQPADVAARYAQKKHVPFIFHPMYYARHKLTWQAYAHLIGKKTFAAADVVAVISPYEQSLIEAAGFPVKRFELLPPGIDTHALSQPHVNPYVARGIKGTVFLGVGRLSASKGFDTALRAFVRLHAEQPNINLVIIGEDFGEEAALKQLSQELKATNVHFWGKVDTPTLLGAYQHATALVQPSHYEAFGITAAEALAAGTPVIARNVAAVPYVVPDDKAGLLFNTDEELYRALKTIVASPEAAKRLGTAGQQHVRQNFSWETTITRLLALYEELAI